LQAKQKLLQTKLECNKQHNPKDGALKKIDFTANLQEWNYTLEKPNPFG